MLLSDFDYHLPDELVAQEPLPDRAASRMLVVDRAGGQWHDAPFRDFPSYLRPGDCLVLNESRVIPSRLFGHRKGARALPVGKNNPRRREHLSGTVEVFLLHPLSDDRKMWRTLVRPGRKMLTGEVVHFADGFEGEIVEHGELGERTIRLEVQGDLDEALQRVGHVPLPPYIKRSDSAEDRERYQTVFARTPGSVAAPTAGLHFTPEILERCLAAGAEIARVALHVGLGTFQPIHTEEIEQHKLHAERFEVSEHAALTLERAERRVAAGTTSVRTMEHLALTGGFRSARGETDLFIRPGFQFAATGAMLTNFHLPRSSLLVLVCAFAGMELTLAAYHHAVAERYRFYSYGDCMLVL